MDGCRFSNESDLEAYLQQEPGKRFDESILSEKDKQEEYFFVGLRMTNGVSLNRFRERFGVDAENVYPGLLERIIESGGAEIDGDRFRLTEYGMDVSNYIMAQFLME